MTRAQLYTAERGVLRFAESSLQEADDFRSVLVMPFKSSSGLRPCVSCADYPEKRLS